MSSPYIGEIRIFAGNFAPLGWHDCDGALLLVNDNTELFSLIGTTYGGDGQTTFALPDLRGRLPVHMGQGPGLAEYKVGGQGGAEEVTLSVNQLPSHTHPFNATANLGTDTGVGGKTMAKITAGDLYFASANPPQTVAMAAAAVGGTGGSQPHNNLMPFLCLTFIICLKGSYPVKG